MSMRDCVNSNVFITSRYDQLNFNVLVSETLSPTSTHLL